MTPDRLPPRIAAKIEPEPMSGCWLWTAAISSQGYGRVCWQGKTRFAHRVVYELLVGPIPVELELDHLCRNPICVSPWHADPVAHVVNVRRGQQYNVVKTHCKHGHPFSTANTYRSGNRRTCRTCKLAIGARRRQRQRSA